MLASSIPTKFSIPFANSAGASYRRTIPTDSQIGITPGRASLTDGFPPVCFTPVGGGGTPPAGADFNGILYESTASLQWLNAGNVFYPYDGTYQGTIGGYNTGAIVASATTANRYYISTVDSNMSDPDTGGANWITFSLGGGSNRTVLASGAFTTNASDLGGSIGIYRTGSITGVSTTLPSSPAQGNRIRYYDLSKNFNQGAFTVNAQSGATIEGSAQVVFNVNGQAPEFEFFGTVGGGPLWGLKN